MTLKQTETSSVHQEQKNVVFVKINQVHISVSMCVVFWVTKQYIFPNVGLSSMFSEIKAHKFYEKVYRNYNSHQCLFLNLF